MIFRIGAREVDQEVADRAILVLEDGRWFTGYRFGAPVEAEAEVVFNTGMTGYQEICTDPSYRGQMVVMTYPLIGNYGVNWEEDAESTRPWLAALLVREFCLNFSNWRANEDIYSYLYRNGIPGIYGVDTRALTRHLRTKGTLRAVLTAYDENTPVQGLIERAKQVTPLSERDLVSETVTVPPPDYDEIRVPLGCLAPSLREGSPTIVLVDCGTKRNILRSLTSRGAEVMVVPFSATVEEIMALQPDGVVVSNGPGDPASLPAPVATVREIISSGTPLLGICLGHQILGRAIGATTSRLRFGHHGSNHPVKEILSGEVHITSQNHEFQVDGASIPKESGFFVSHVNLNDGSVEGLAHSELPVFSVQYHPEGCPGPQDNQYLFDKFVKVVLAKKRGVNGR
ncbi:MAG: glutamine-hydrolyzing carbamoyl-phosphate synthase small subunit [Chloroflexi bacterium]|nr:glutamine-hydrolyzing carbamoyl-phosphate synthase small subunit [Chloroflexota bacterium]